MGFFWFPEKHTYFGRSAVDNFKPFIPGRDKEYSDQLCKRSQLPMSHAPKTTYLIWSCVPGAKLGGLDQISCHGARSVQNLITFQIQAYLLA